MTDDLDMGAIAKHFDIRTVIRQVMTADIDIALICHSMEKMEIAHGQMTQSVAASESLKRANKLSFDRIMHLKQTYLIS